MSYLASVSLDWAISGLCFVISGFCFVTARLDHDREVSRDGRPDPERQSHNGESDGPASLGRGPAHNGPEDHGQGEDVAVGKEGKVVVLNGQTPPRQL